jgi:5-methyltetrahydropteroyltriglutamate--homocysteine methyltransferase
VKGILTGPYTMVDWSFDEYYGDRVRAVLDMAEVVHQEALELDEAGAPFIQVDEPAASTRLDEMDLVSRGLTIVTQGLKAKTGTHICYGDFARAFQQIVDLPVGHLEVAPPERLYIDPDCGLKTRTWDEAAAKLRVMVQGVRQVRKELGID